MIERVDDFLFRGNKPISHKEIEELGINAVIDLRDINEQPFDAYDCEDPAQFNIKKFSIPMSGVHKPNTYQINQFIRAIWYCINNNKKCLVHCHYGKDRTGFMVAIYRIYFNTWKPSGAINEMMAHGFNRLMLHHWIRELEKFELNKETPMYSKWGGSGEI